MLNLIESRWLPVLRRSGHTRIAPWEMADRDDPPLLLAAGRADFNASLLQFLIGLTQTVLPPRDGQEWLSRYLEAPSNDDLKSAFAPLAPWFRLGGESPRFMQDFAPQELAAQEPKDVMALLIDAPGEKTIEENRDFFAKRGTVRGLCACCSAASLITLQTNAPGCGKGNNASLRRGGPLTTFVEPSGQGGGEVTLWHRVWLNVIEPAVLGPNHPWASDTTPQHLFPWATPTRVSARPEGSRQRPEVSYADGHPLFVYWATPRRIWLDFEQTQTGACDLCGEASERLVQQYRAKNYGANYTSGWRHPLSPYYRKTADDPELMPLHAKGGLGYRDWLGLVGASIPTAERAAVVRGFEARRQQLSRQLRDPRRMPFRLRACGYEMDLKLTAKVLCWHEATMPLPSVDLHRVEPLVVQWIAAAELVASFLRGALKAAWFSPGATVRADFDFATVAFWQATEADFYTLLDDLSLASADAPASDETQLLLRQRWQQTLRRSAERLFERHAESGPAEQGNAKRVALAHQQLQRNLYGQKLKAALGLPEQIPPVLQNPKPPRKRSAISAGGSTA